MPSMWRDYSYGDRRHQEIVENVVVAVTNNQWVLVDTSTAQDLALQVTASIAVDMNGEPVDFSVTEV